MRRLAFTLTLIVLALSFTLDASAQKKKKRKNKGDVEIVVPCNGPEYMTDNQFLRATSTSLSTNMDVAKKKAMLAARQEIAMLVETTVKAVTENFITSFQEGENDDTRQTFKDMTRESAKQSLKGVRLICNKMMRTPDGNYRAYVTLELAGETIMNDVADAIMNDDRMRTEFEFEKFKEVFNEEMDNIANN